MITSDKSHSSFVTTARKLSESIVISSYEKNKKQCKKSMLHGYNYSNRQIHHKLKYLRNTNTGYYSILTRQDCATSSGWLKALNVHKSMRPELPALRVLKLYRNS